jgi:hypothetical protein
MLIFSMAAARGGEGKQGHERKGSNMDFDL